MATGAAITWGELLGTEATNPVDPYTRSTPAARRRCGRSTWAPKSRRLKGTAVNGNPGVAEAVRQDPLALGYNNVGFASGIQPACRLKGWRLCRLT